MSHVITISPATASNVVVDLRPQDAAGTSQGPNYFHAVRVQINIIGTSLRAIVQPVHVNDTDAAPAAATLNPVGGVANLSTASNPSITIGQQYGPGPQPGVFREPLATHLRITTLDPSALLQIIVD